MQAIIINHSFDMLKIGWYKLIILTSACLFNISCVQTEQPQKIAIKEKIKFFSFVAPGKLEDAQKSGFTCKRTTDRANYDCTIKDSELYGVILDAHIRLHEFGDAPDKQKKFQYADADMGYSEIELITRKPSIFKKKCKDNDEISLVHLDGTIEKINNVDCIEDKREVFDKALLKNGWTKTYYKGTNTYTHQDINLVIKHALDSESFRIIMEN